VERSTHDLLNPISSILGFGETLRARGESLGDETIRSFGASIARQAARLEGAIRDLGLVSRLLRETPVAHPIDFDLKTMLVAAAPDRVRVEAPAGVIVAADQDLLEGALGRLIANALEFSEGEVVVRAGEGWIEVADTGIGFEPDGLSRAFEPFAAGANARNERGPGLGLGLYIARRLIEAQGGRLTATSDAGRGSVFRIALGA
jgi:signal transduction histidine kinase